MDQPAGITSGPSTIISAAAWMDTHRSGLPATPQRERPSGVCGQMVSRYQALPAEMMVNAQADARIVEARTCSVFCGKTTDGAGKT